MSHWRYGVVYEKISLVVVLAVTIIIFAIRVAIGAQNAWLPVADSLNNMVLTLGWMVLVFAIIERLSPSIKSKWNKKEWNLAELMKNCSMKQ